MPFETWDISTWVVMSQEARGLDPKDWVVPVQEVTNPGQENWWLFKPKKVAGYRRHDDWSERLAAELARLIGLPAARVELARGVQDEGIISRNVTPNGWSLESGDTLLSDVAGYVSCATDDRPPNRVGHNLHNIDQVLDGVSGPPLGLCADWRAIEVFAGYLVFDAWIANTDRHAVNWGVLTREKDGARALAASFDHGTALASGAQDAWLHSTSAVAFAERGCAGRFEGGRKVTLVELALGAVQAAGGRAGVWLNRLAAVEPSGWQDALGSIANMSEGRRTFLGDVLETNQRRLTS